MADKSHESTHSTHKTSGPLSPMTDATTLGKPAAGGSQGLTVQKVRDLALACKGGDKTAADNALWALLDEIRDARTQTPPAYSAPGATTIDRPLKTVGAKLEEACLEAEGERGALAAGVEGIPLDGGFLSTIMPLLMAVLQRLYSGQ